MYIHELPDTLDRAFFLECATLILMREGDWQKNLLAVDKEKKGDIIEPYAYCLSELDKVVLEEYAEDAAKNTAFSYEKFSSFIKGTLRNKNGAYSPELVFQPNDKMYNRRTLSYLFRTASDLILKEYSNNQNVKQEVIEILTKGGIDLLNIDQYAIRNVTLELPEIKNLVFSKVLDKLIESKKEIINSFRIRNKKLFILELANIGISTGGYKESQQKLVYQIAEGIGLDKETFDEMQEASAHLHKLARELEQAKQELFELINE